MPDTKFKMVKFFRSHLGIAQKTMTKAHIYNDDPYQTRKTLCRWSFEFMGTMPKVAQYIKADIDEYWMLQPEDVCKTCYGEFLKNTGRFIEYEIETQTPSQCGCRVMIRETKDKKVAKIYFCNRHKEV